MDILVNLLTNYRITEGHVLLCSSWVELGWNFDNIHTWWESFTPLAWNMDKHVCVNYNINDNNNIEFAPAHDAYEQCTMYNA